jgi:hypothetical protein
MLEMDDQAIVAWRENKQNPLSQHYSSGNFVEKQIRSVKANKMF